MRISDWSSDVCSSDLVVEALGAHRLGQFVVQLGRHRLADLLHRALEDRRLARQLLVAVAFREGDVHRAGLAHGGTDELLLRSEERRVGKECVSTCISRGSTDYSKKKA